MDYWSDTDLTIVLSKGIELTDSMPDDISKGLGFVLAKEIHRGSERITLRLVIQQDQRIELLDLSILTFSQLKNEISALQGSYQILYGSIPEVPKPLPVKPSFSFHYSGDSINQTWFVFYQCVKKFMRQDHLIGLHLLMRLVQEYLVIAMIERDQTYQTNIHRFGYREELESDIHPRHLNYMDKDAILDYINRLAFRYDEKLLHSLHDYSSRYAAFELYIENSRSEARQS